MLVSHDKLQITDRGSSPEVIESQIESFKKGFPFLEAISAATISKGIVTVNKEIKEELINYFDETSREDCTILKFVPSSGAASRMFQKLFAFLNACKNNNCAAELLAEPEHGATKQFFDDIENFAFYAELTEILKDSMKVDNHWNYVRILETVLAEPGLNYGALPKGLISFHKYEGFVRTPLEEHLREAIEYARDKENVCRIHFTVSPEHLPLFKAEAEKALAKLKEDFDATFDISYSVQKASTDTIAVTPENEPFRTNDGSILFRPGGHGALLENLNDIDSADVIYIKNIDNVVPDHLKGDTFDYKKVIGGLLLKTQNQIFEYLRMLDQPEGTLSSKQLTEMMEFVQTTLCYKPTLDPYYTDKEDLIDLLKTTLNRPTRVCGMVKNEGEPGGGPFWARNSDGSSSLQVVEGSQIDPNSESQAKIVNGATHFNPVDLVCAVRNYKGEKFDLLEFRDPETGFISQKSKEGRDLKALELPGLWNGAMANWNTIFVEVPISTFNPVKTVNDLLRINHQ